MTPTAIVAISSNEGTSSNAGLVVDTPPVKRAGNVEAFMHKLSAL